VSDAAVTVAIRTADLHRMQPRIAAHDGATRLAAIHRRRLLGDRLSPTLTGDLAGEVVSLSWPTEPETPAPEPSPEAQARLWCSRMWADREGRAVLAVGHGGHYKGTAYSFGREFEQRSYRWPEQRDELLHAALEAAPASDVYVSVLLHQSGTRGREKATAAPGGVAWVDVDGDWTLARQAALDTLGVECWQVESGARGGRHLYVPLGQLVGPERLEQVNRRLARALDGDSGWERTKVLRLPGTLNHKPRPHGLPSAPVRWLP
jgi:PAS domain-containing protein